jgi:hypothetical protein
VKDFTILISKKTFKINLWCFFWFKKKILLFCFCIWCIINNYNYNYDFFFDFTHHFNISTGNKIDDWSGAPKESCSLGPTNSLKGPVHVVFFKLSELINCIDEGETFWNDEVEYHEIKLKVRFCTPGDALVVRNILSFIYKILSQFVKPPSDTLLRERVNVYFQFCWV